MPLPTDNALGIMRVWAPGRPSAGSVVRWHHGPVRLSQFWQLMDDEFGPGYARVLADRQALAGVGGRTASEALSEGVGPRAVWQAMCDVMDVPQSRRLGVDHRPRR